MNREFIWLGTIDGDMNKPGNYNLNGQAATELPGRNYPTYQDTLGFSDHDPYSEDYCANPATTGPTAQNAMTLAAHWCDPYYAMAFGWGAECIFHNMTIKGSAELYGSRMSGGLVEGGLNNFAGELSDGTVQGNYYGQDFAQFSGGTVQGDCTLDSADALAYSPASVGGNLVANNAQIGGLSVDGDAEADGACIIFDITVGGILDLYGYMEGGTAGVLNLYAGSQVAGGAFPVVRTFGGEVTGGVEPTRIEFYRNATCDIVAIAMASSALLMGRDVVVTEPIYGDLLSAARVRRGVRHLAPAALGR
jgi:hypothetical protein